RLDPVDIEVAHDRPRLGTLRSHASNDDLALDRGLDRLDRKLEPEVRGDDLRDEPLDDLVAREEDHDRDDRKESEGAEKQASQAASPGTPRLATLGHCFGLAPRASFRVGLTRASGGAKAPPRCSPVS